MSLQLTTVILLAGVRTSISHYYECFPNYKKNGSELGGSCIKRANCCTPDSVCQEHTCQCWRHYLEVYHLGRPYCLPYITGIGEQCCDPSQCKQPFSDCIQGVCSCVENYVDLPDGQCHEKVGLYEPCEIDEMCAPAFSVCGDTNFCVCEQGHVDTAGGLCSAASWHFTMMVVVVAIIILVVALLVSFTARWKINRLHNSLRERREDNGEVRRPVDAPPPFADLPRISADPPAYDSIYVTSGSGTFPKIPTYEEAVRQQPDNEGVSNQAFSFEEELSVTSSTNNQAGSRTSNTSSSSQSVHNTMSSSRSPGVSDYRIQTASSISTNSGSRDQTTCNTCRSSESSVQAAHINSINSHNRFQSGPNSDRNCENTQTGESSRIRNEPASTRSIANSEC